MNPIITIIAIVMIIGSIAFTPDNMAMWSGLVGSFFVLLVARALRGPDKAILREVLDYEHNGGVTVIQYYDGAEKAHFVRGPAISKQARNWVQTVLEKTNPNIKNGEEYEYTEVYVKNNRIDKVIDHYWDWPAFQKKMEGHSGAHGQQLFQTFVDEFNGPDRKKRRRSC